MGIMKQLYFNLSKSAMSQKCHSGLDLFSPELTIAKGSVSKDIWILVGLMNNVL